ncbi:probable WRKY transcription factor 70 [Argentina anserina]|uniref:probable WRKY transcription factor 70 n=1 Tax=Argentina anserina TaxID=57926 RepID=UPI0021764FEA|nr:probable WRKY transcription factor 70 [Potentilla anserina]
MEWTWQESVSSNRQRVLEELVHGREMANQLRGALGGDVRSAEGIVTKILGSFTNTLLILNGSQEAKEELTSQVQANSNTSAVTASASGSGSGTGSVIAGADSSSWDVVRDDAMKSEDSNEESCKSTDRRGSYKRRKTSHSWTKDTLDLVDDGHAWRKYGQKMILGSGHPRNYFRCTHKFDQGCKAIKHVQRIQDEPQLYRTTYYGNHTCTDYLRTPHELILDCSNRQESSQNMIRFDNTNNASTCKQEHPFFSTFTSIEKESVKVEQMTKIVSDHDHHITHHNQSLSLCDYLTSPGLGMFESFEPISGLSSTIAYDDDMTSSIMVAGYFEAFDHEIDFPFKF